MYYEFKIKTKRETPRGVKEVTELYLTDCELFAEAEHAGMSLTAGKGDVVAIYRSDVKEIVNPNETDGDYYKATVVDVFTKDDGTTKEIKYRVLVNAADLQNATNIVREYMRQGLQDMRLDKVEKSKILEVI